MTGVLILLLVGFVCAVAFTSSMVARRLRRPPRRTYAWAVSRGVPGTPGELARPLKFEEWSFEWRGVSCPVWDVVGDDSNGLTIVFTPGWGDSRIGALVRAARLAKFARRMILWDPPGLGETDARVKWNMGTDDHAALRELVRRACGAEERVALYGWSAGAGASIVAGEGGGESGEKGTRHWALGTSEEERDHRAQSAEQQIGMGANGCADGPRVVCVIAEAPYRLPWTPAVNVLRLAGMPTFVVPLVFAALGLRLGVGARWRGFDRAPHAAGLRVPLLVLHGDADEVCPVEDGRAIGAAAPVGRVVEIRGAGHNDLWTDPRYAAECERVVGEFLKMAKGQMAK